MSTKSVMEIAALDWAVMYGTFARGTSTWGHFNLLSDDSIHAAVLAGDITSDQGLFLLRFFDEEEWIFILIDDGGLHINEVDPVEAYCKACNDYAAYLDAHALKTGDR